MERVVSETDVGGLKSGSSGAPSLEDSSLRGCDLVMGPSLIRRARTRGERAREKKRWTFGVPW